MEFLGYERPDGSVGIRNHVAVISSGRCANELAATIADAGQGAGPVITTHPCARLKEDNERAIRFFTGVGINPNVAAALVVGVGCDNPSPHSLAEEIAESKKPVEALSVMESEGFQDFIDRGTAIARRMAADASEMQRKPFPLSYLTLGVKCGGSSAVSGLAGNLAVGMVFDRLIAEGGTAIFSETTEVIGADHLLARRAINKEVARKFRDMVVRHEAMIKATGEDIRGTQPTRGNIAGGLTTIEEKSLGALAKTGTTPLQGALEHGEKPQGKGLYFMDGSAQTSELISGEMAAGALIHIYSTGGGITSSFRCTAGWGGEIPVIPQISVVSRQSTPRDSQEKDFFDIFADAVIEGTETVGDVADRFFDEIIAVASGKLTRREMRRSGYREPIVLYTLGPIL
jgi:altronate dehydratase large subunit